MSLLKSPNELSSDVKLSMLIYGQPGLGKTTLALSAPSPVLIDADKGIKRVEKRFQVPSLPLDDYWSFRELLKSPELAPFQTIVVDTMGKLVDRMGDWLMKRNDKLRQSDGSLTMKGYGALKTEFQSLLREMQSLNKHIIFVAHEREDKDGDTRIIRPDVSGSSGKDLVKDLDLMGYMEMKGKRRTISFNPCEKFYAKNSLKLPDIIDVPDTKDGNAFIEDIIIGKTLEKMKSDQAQNDSYDKLLSGLYKTIDAAKDASGANDALTVIDNSEPIWDSQRQAKKRLAEKVKSLGLVYDKDKKEFVK